MTHPLDTLQSIANRIPHSLGPVDGVNAIIAVDDLRKEMEELRKLQFAIQNYSLQEIEELVIRMRTEIVYRKFQIAESLGIERSTLDRKIKRYQIPMKGKLHVAEDPSSSS